MAVVVWGDGQWLHRFPNVGDGQWLYRFPYVGDGQWLHRFPYVGDGLCVGWVCGIGMSDRHYSYGEEDVDVMRPLGWASLLCI